MRDYFLPRLSADYVRFEPVPATTGDMAILNQVTVQELWIPEQVGHSSAAGDLGAWREGSDRLVGPPMCRGWTGHSERCTMPSLFAAMGVPKAERDPLGRWSPSGSDDYVRTYRALIRDLMGRFRRSILAGGAGSFADEDEAIDDAMAFSGRLGLYDDEALKVAAARLALASTALFLGLAGQPVAEAEQFEKTAAVAQLIPPHDDWGVTAPEDVSWDNFAADLGSRSRAKQGLLERPLDPRTALDLLPCEVDAEDDDLGYKPVVPYLVVTNKKVRRLHRTNGCWRAVALAFREFEYVDLEPVPADRFTHYCRGCWPAPAVGDSDSSGGEIGSSSSDSGSSGP